jgi:hypothetical protein
VKLTDPDPGVSSAYNGGTHIPFEDLGIMWNIPKLVVFEPSADRYLRKSSDHEWFGNSRPVNLAGSKIRIADDMQACKDRLKAIGSALHDCKASVISFGHGLQASKACRYMFKRCLQGCKAYRYMYGRCLQGCKPFKKVYGDSLQAYKRSLTGYTISLQACKA